MALLSRMASQTCRTWPAPRLLGELPVEQSPELSCQCLVQSACAGGPDGRGQQLEGMLDVGKITRLQLVHARSNVRPDGPEDSEMTLLICGARRTCVSCHEHDAPEEVGECHRLKLVQPTDALPCHGLSKNRHENQRQGSVQTIQRTRHQLRRAAVVLFQESRKRSNFHKQNSVSVRRVPEVPQSQHRVARMLSNAQPENRALVFIFVLERAESHPTVSMAGLGLLRRSSKHSTDTIIGKI